MTDKDMNVATPCGGDGSNMFYFYTGSQSYANNSVKNIATFAQERFESCKDKSVEEIESKHIFWGTEGSGFKGFYNGDTYVLFDDIEKLPEDIKQDAQKYCKGYREQVVTKEEKSVVPTEFDPVDIRYISSKCVKEAQSKTDGSPYYRVGLTVGKDVSENGYANIAVSKKNAEFHNGSWTLHFPDNRDINARVMKDGAYKTESLVLSDLAGSHAQVVKEGKAKRTLPSAPEVQESSPSTNYEME